ncbi:MAG: phospholipase D family protein [Roseivirga sp.]
MSRASKKSQKSQPRMPLLAALLLGGIIGYETATYFPVEQAPLFAEHADVQVRFSPGGHCTQWVEETIAKAQKTILVQAYSFTSLPIAEALIAAHQRGVVVKILVDRSQLTGKYTQVQRVVDRGIAVAVDKVPGIAHNKVMVIDNDYVLTGSFNWTRAAETRNAENLILIKGEEVNRIYRTNWEQRASSASAVSF